MPGGGDWWRHGVIYQVYPRSFADSNGDGIGDLAGIASRLDHLNDGTPRSLGVDAIWLSPFYPSPLADFGYDVADYRGVHPDFGTLEDFDHLVAAAHARGLRMIVDLVPNHTSDRHPWFLASRSDRDDPKRDWYVWADSRQGGAPPNNWDSVFEGVGPAWTFDERTGQWYLHSFLPQQPDLNWWNPEVRAAMDGVLRFWLDRGVDGFRIDVVHRLVKDRELRDNPPPAGAARPIRHDEDRPETHEVLRGFRRTLDAYHDRMAVGEVYLLDPSRVVRYYGDGDELHLAFNFSFLWQPWRAEAFRAAADLFERLLPEGAWPDYTLSNHDHARAASRFDGGDQGQARARVAAMMLLTLRGTPFLYYGEELGMPDVPVPADRVVDMAGRDGARTPMQWDATANAGFTSGRPWLPVAADHATRNVAAQRDDPTSMLRLYQRLIWYRKSSPALREGSYHSLRDTPPGLFAYLRETAGERLLVALNFSPSPLAYQPSGDLPARGRLEVSTDPTAEPGREVSLGPLKVPGDAGLLVRLGQP